VEILQAGHLVPRLLLMDLQAALVELQVLQLKGQIMLLFLH
jgi:hypothetical protein